MLNVLVERNQNYGLVVSSRNVAQGLKKRHDHVLRDLDEIIRGLPKFGETSKVLIIPSFYANRQNKQQYREYLLTKDGFILYMFNIQGYLDFKLAYIQKFNEMEEQLKSPRIEKFMSPTGDYGDINKSIENMEKYLEESKTWIVTALASINNLDQLRRETLTNLKFMKSDLKKEPKLEPLTVKEYAKKLDTIGVKKMYIWLRENGYVEVGTCKPTENAIKDGLFTLEETEWTFSQGKKIGGFKSRITPKGQKYFEKIFENKQLRLQ